MSVTAIAFFTSITALGTVEPAHTQVFDLKKSIEFAVAHSPEFDSLQRQLSIYELEEKTAIARQLPSLDLTATHGIVDSDPKTKTTPWSSQFNLGLTESLYDNGVTNSNRHIAHLNHQQAELNFKQQRNRLSLEIVHQFLIYSLNVKLAEIQEKQFKLVSKQHNIVSNDYHQGTKTKKDFLRFKTQINRSEIDLINSKNTVEKSKQELQRLLGIGISVQENPIFVPLSLDKMDSKIQSSSVDLESHLLYKIAKIQKEANQLSVDIVSRKKFPELFLTAGIDYSSSSYIDTKQSFGDNGQIGWNALLTLKYNFIDWGIRSRDSIIASQKNMIQNNQLDVTLLGLMTLLNQLQVEVVQIQRNYLLAKELLSLEQSNINFIEREYRTGRVQYLDFISGLNNLSDAELKFYSSASDLQKNKFNILYHQGKLYEELLK
jgi:outer membrane protein TolC